MLEKKNLNIDDSKIQSSKTIIREKVNVLSIGSMIFGIFPFLWIIPLFITNKKYITNNFEFFCVSITVSPIISIIFGFISKKEIQESKTYNATSYRMSITGIMLGFLTFGLFLLFLIDLILISIFTTDTHGIPREHLTVSIKDKYVTYTILLLSLMILAARLVFIFKKLNKK